MLAAVPEDPKAAYLNAALLARAGDLDASRSALEQAARTIGGLDPDYVLNHGPSLLIAGVIKYAQGNFNESYAYLNRYVGAFPHQPGARKLLGDILLRRGEAQRAIEILKPATAEAPDDTALLGLLGTVIGLIKVFSTIMVHGVGNANQLAGGISEALITTAAGLTVAIPSFFFYRFFKSRVEAFVVTMEEQAINLIEAIERGNVAQLRSGVPGG